MGRTKTTTSDDDERVVLIGRPVVALRCWLEVADIKDGPGFRRIDQGKRRSARAHAAVGQSHPEKPLQASRLDPTLLSAHGLRSGYLTEAANRGMPLPEAMQQSLHKWVSQAARYYNDAE